MRFLSSLFRIFAALIANTRTDLSGHMHRAVMAPTNRNKFPGGYKPMARPITSFKF